MSLGPDGHMDRPIKITIDSTDDPIPLIFAQVEGETYPRFVLKSDGAILTGNGSAAPA